MATPKGKVCLLNAAELTKKTLTGISIAHFSVENVADNDFSDSFKREEMDQVIKDQLHHHVSQYFDKQSSPSSKNHYPPIESFFQKPLSPTLHSEESIAKGYMLTAVQL
jgi:hypothetical protein